MEEAADYFIDSVLQSVADPAVDGTFLDDIGFGGEHAQMLIDTRLTKQEVAAINNASLRTYARLKQRLIAAGKFDWQSLGLGDFAGPGIKRNASIGNLNPFRQSFDLGCKPHNIAGTWVALFQECQQSSCGPGLEFMRTYCNESNQHAPMLQGLVDGTPANISVAAFLITRGPIAFIGSGVLGAIPVNTTSTSCRRCCSLGC